RNLVVTNRKLIAGGIIIALLIGVAAVFFASGDPDGLESTALMIQGQKTLTGGTPADAKVHEDMNGKFSYSAPMPDYSLGGTMGPLGGILATVAGILLAVVGVLGVAWTVKYLSRAKEDQAKE
ncbi:MAG TPA: PDGLE domain-containing protein, partial [Methanomicrobiales archaeon]|nr:PDGLE domain-containing protein [Methanomicrobiales archaeon]